MNYLQQAAKDAREYKGAIGEAHKIRLVILSQIARVGHCEVSDHVMRKGFISPPETRQTLLTLAGCRPETSAEDQIKRFCHDHDLEYRNDMDNPSGYSTKHYFRLKRK